MKKWYTVQIKDNCEDIKNAFRNLKGGDLVEHTRRRSRLDISWEEFRRKDAKGDKLK